MKLHSSCSAKRKLFVALTISSMAKVMTGIAFCYARFYQIVSKITSNNLVLKAKNVFSMEVTKEEEKRKDNSISLGVF